MTCGDGGVRQESERGGPTASRAPPIFSIRPPTGFPAGILFASHFRPKSRATEAVLPSRDNWVSTESTGAAPAPGRVNAMRRMSLVLAAGFCGLAAWFATDPAAARQDARPDGVEVLTRGPVHEAYAEPTDPTPRATPVVPQQPPEPVPELPPDTRPEGDNVVWIAGYWAWDDDSRGFLWVSGFWREAPPGRRWV